MSNELKFEPNEQIIYSNEFQADKYTLPFTLTITNQAVFLQREKHFAKESLYFEKVPHSQIKQVYLKKERVLTIWIISIITFLFGLALSVNMMFNALNESSGTYVSGIPFAIVVCGLLMPFLSKGKRTLVIQLMNETYKWKPKFVVDKQSRNHIKNMQKDILKACQKVGIHVFDEIKP